MALQGSWKIRLLGDGDVPRVLEISARIWEGYDYVPQVIGDWLHREDGEVLGVFREKTLIAFGHTLCLFPDLVWMEGLRSDPAQQGQGAGRALAEGALERVRSQGYKKAAFSTYVENRASIHINESLGFVRQAEFIYAYIEEEKGLQGIPWRETIEPSDTEIAEFLADSPAFAGWLAEGWRFFPFARDPGRSLAHHPWRLGISRGKKLVALLLGSRGHDGPAIDFLEGEPEAMRKLVLDLLARIPVESYAEVIVSLAGDPATTLAILEEMGFRTEHQGQPDLFVYCKDLTKNT